jgi:hypothetical protein
MSTYKILKFNIVQNLLLKTSNGKCLNKWIWMILNNLPGLCPPRKFQYKIV